MTAMIECLNCGASGPATDDTCAYCGATPEEASRGPADGLPADDVLAYEAPAQEAGAGEVPPVAPADVAAPEEAPGEAPEEDPPDLPPAPEARRVRGLAVPLVAALVVLGIGYPLTALAVSRVGRLPSTSGVEPARGGGSSAPTPTPGRARLEGAVIFDGPVQTLGCTSGRPRLLALDLGDVRYSIILGAPPGAGAGTYELQATPGTFIVITRLAGGSQSWTSLGRPGATGIVTVGADQSISARFGGLEPAAGGAAGTVAGSFEARCA